MLDSHAAQWALRAGASSVGSDLKDGNEHAKTFESTATQRVEDLLKGGGSYAALSSQLTVQAALVTVAVGTMALAYSSISDQLKELGNQRLAYFKERKAGTATFIVPTNKEPREMYTEQNFMREFVELTAQYAFTNYTCQQSTTFPEQHNYFYSVLPFYSTSEKLGRPFKNLRLIDRQRRAIDLFLKSAVPEFLSDLDKPFRHEGPVTSFFSSTWNGTNYTNDFRSARFLIMSMANLLWSLQHPIDPKTSYPHTLDNCIKLCRNIRTYLNSVLALITGPCFQSMKKSHLLANFVRKIDAHVNALWDAYEDELLHEVNIDEVTNSAHQALEVMDKSILNIIYRQRSIKAGDSIYNAAENLVDKITYLQLSFLLNPELISKFHISKQLNKSIIGINTPPITVVDALLIFCHTPKPDREALIKSLQEPVLEEGKIRPPSSSELGLAITLEKINDVFIWPVDKICKEELIKKSEDNYANRAIFTARRLMPFITLVIDDYGIDIDTPVMVNEIKERRKKNGTPAPYTGREQIEFINKHSQDVFAHYQLTLSPFLNAKKDTLIILNQLIARQTRMRNVTKLLDNISEIIHHYRSFLQEKVFQKFLIDCLRRVKDEYVEMSGKINKLDKQISDDETMSLTLKETLGQMASEMDTRLTAFTKATESLHRVIESPSFPEEQRSLLIRKIDAIDHQFYALFKQRSGLDAWSTKGEPISHPFMGEELDNSVSHISSTNSLPPTGEKVSSNKMIALSQLAHRCYDGLSYLSRFGYKGQMLHNLIVKIDTTPDFNQLEFEEIIKELVRLSASYRETYFFQATYGQSRSAKIMINAIKDPQLNSIFPLASIIFDKPDINYANQTDEQIVIALESLRRKYEWQPSLNRIEKNKPVLEALSAPVELELSLEQHSPT